MDRAVEECATKGILAADRRAVYQFRRPPKYIFRRCRMLPRPAQAASHRSQLNNADALVPTFVLLKCLRYRSMFFKSL